MLSRPQQILLKRAQQDAHIPDEDYRDSIAAVAGMPDCRSSKDPRLTNEHLDRLLKWFEVIHWQALDTVCGERAERANRSTIFPTRNHWKNRNQKGHTSRDTYTERELTDAVLAAKQKLLEHGCSSPYLAAIRSRIQPFSLRTYLAALNRTLAAKQRKSFSASASAS